MVIRKLYRVETAHIVRNCSTKKCSNSIHGHMGVIEIFLTSDKLDSGSMLVDFGLLKGPIHDFIDSFDHSLSLWCKESPEYLGYQSSWSDRNIILPVSPSAESYSLMFLFVIDKIIKNTQFNNGEGNVQITSVRYHETITGYAESFLEDLKWVDYDIKDIKFSDGIKSDWKTNWLDDLLNNIKYVNVKPKHQIEI